MDFKVRGLECKKKKKTGGLELGWVNGTRVRDGARCMVRGVNGVRVRDRDGVRCRVRDRDGVRAGSGCAIFLRNTPLPPKKK